MTEPTKHLLPPIHSIADLELVIRQTFPKSVPSQRFAIDLIGIAYSLGKLDGIRELGQDLRETFSAKTPAIDPNDPNLESRN
jgi:hypothetical protein